MVALNSRPTANIIACELDRNPSPTSESGVQHPKPLHSDGLDFKQVRYVSWKNYLLTTRNNKILSFNLITDEWKYYDLPSGNKVGSEGYTNQLINIEDEVEATVIEQDPEHSNSQKGSSLFGMIVNFTVTFGSGYFLFKLLV